MKKNLLFAMTTDNKHAYSFAIYNDGTLSISSNAVMKNFTLRASTIKRLNKLIAKVRIKLKNIPEELNGWEDNLNSHISELQFADKFFRINNIINEKDKPNEDYFCVARAYLEISLFLEKVEPMVISSAGFYMIDHTRDIYEQIQNIRHNLLSETDEGVKHCLLVFLLTALHWCNHKVFLIAETTTNDQYNFCLYEDILDKEAKEYMSMPFNDLMYHLIDLYGAVKVKYLHTSNYWSTDAIRDCFLKNETI